MATLPKSSIAVVFIAQRTADDEAGYASAAAAMVALAGQQPGYPGMDSVRDTGGLIRDAGRDRWYSHYSLHVGEIMRSYDWQKG